MISTAVRAAILAPLMTGKTAEKGGKYYTITVKPHSKIKGRDSKTEKKTALAYPFDLNYYLKCLGTAKQTYKYNYHKIINEEYIIGIKARGTNTLQNEKH